MRALELLECKLDDEWVYLEGHRFENSGEPHERHD